MKRNSEQLRVTIKVIELKNGKYRLLMNAVTSEYRINFTSYIVWLNFIKVHSPRLYTNGKNSEETIR